jgi:hypothetical protein
MPESSIAVADVAVDRHEAPGHVAAGAKAKPAIHVAMRLLDAVARFLASAKAGLLDDEGLFEHARIVVILLAGVLFVVTVNGQKIELGPP